MEYRLRRHDGEFRWILDRGTPRYLPDGTFAGYIGSCVDITERRQLEVDLRKAVKVRDEFLSIASHELRTPLTSLKLRAERLYQQRDASRRRRASWTPRGSSATRSVALTQVLHLVRMVDVLLDVSRISEGPLALDRDELDVGPLVAGVADRLKEPASTAGSPIRVEIRGARDRALGSLPHRAGGDEPAVERDQVRRRASRSTSWSTATTAARASWSRIAAPASTREHHGRLFERFARFAPARHYGGFGLGLWIARVIVEAHGGTIGVDSQVGAGRVLLRRPAAHHRSSVGQLD